MAKSQKIEVGHMEYVRTVDMMGAVFLKDSLSGLGFTQADDFELFAVGDDEFELYVTPRVMALTGSLKEVEG